MFWVTDLKKNVHLHVYWIPRQRFQWTHEPLGIQETSAKKPLLKSQLGWLESSWGKPDRVWFHGRKAEMCILVVSYIGVVSFQTVSCSWPPSRLDRANDAVVLRTQIWEMVARIKMPILLFITYVKLGILLNFLNLCLFSKVEIMLMMSRRRTLIALNSCEPSVIYVI